MNGTKHGTEAADYEGRETRGEGREQSSNSSRFFMSVQHYQQLLVWQKAMDLAVNCYQTTRTFPLEERYGLTSQLRRAATSVAANIAEGHARFHTKEFLNHLSMASRFFSGSGNVVDSWTAGWLALRRASAASPEFGR
jgi:hypothetical protein